MTLAKHSFNFSAQTQLSSIDLQHLRFAVAAADHGSFRQAAEAMAVRQSTLSRSILHFEQLIGVSLFERSSGGVSPTIAGRNLLRLARTILEEFETLIATAKSLEAGSLAALLSVFAHPLPRVTCERHCSSSNRRRRRSNSPSSSVHELSWRPHSETVCWMF
jgi:DNA-binding transcriptional LysR family regulator